MTPEELQKLLGLAEQGKTRALAEHAARLQDCAALAQERAALAEGMQAGGGDFTALARWQNWIQAEKRRLDQALQQAEMAAEESRKRALHASARVQALDILLERARAVALRQNRRRAEQNGVPPDA